MRSVVSLRIMGRYGPRVHVVLRYVGADIRFLPSHFISLLPLFSLKLDGVLIVHGLVDIFRLHWYCLCDPGCSEYVE